MKRIRHLITDKQPNAPPIIARTGGALAGRRRDPDSRNESGSVKPAPRRAVALHLHTQSSNAEMTALSLLDAAVRF